MVKLGVIERVEEPTELVSSMVVVTKPKGSLRVKRPQQGDFARTVPASNKG